MTLEDRIWSAVEPRIYISREEYFEALSAWAVTPLADVGAVMVRGPEFHFVTWGKANFTRSDIREVLAPIIAEHGRVETKTPVDDLRMQRFNRAIGFTSTGSDEFFVYFALTRAPFSRKT